MACARTSGQRHGGVHLMRVADASRDGVSARSLSVRGHSLPDILLYSVLWWSAPPAPACTRHRDAMAWPGPRVARSAHAASTARHKSDVPVRGDRAVKHQLVLAVRDILPRRGRLDGLAALDGHAGAGGVVHEAESRAQRVSASHCGSPIGCVPAPRQGDGRNCAATRRRAAAFVASQARARCCCCGEGRQYDSPPAMLADRMPIRDRHVHICLAS